MPGGERCTALHNTQHPNECTFSFSTSLFIAPLQHIQTYYRAVNRNVHAKQE